MGAGITLCFIAWLCLQGYLATRRRVIRSCAAITIVLLLVQVGLGIANVLMVRPLAVAVAHNTVAALLLLSLISQYYLTRED